MSADGVTESVEILVNGRPLLTLDSVTAFTESPNLATRSRLPLGQAGAVLAQDFQGWQGTLTAADGPDGRWQRHLDAYTAARAAHTPYVVTIVRTVFYPQSGDRQVWRYDDVHYGSFDRQSARAGDSTITVSWQTGTARKAVTR